ncbi:hypothetical protein SODG_007585 [Sodalis praecaptivus]|nr:hypothetical protein NVIRENTERO_02565 [Sodalis praecaptivus]
MHISKRCRTSSRVSSRYVRSLRLSAVLVCLCLLALLTGCVRTQTKYLPIPPAPIPAALLDDCPPPVIPEHMTWGDSVILNEKLLLALEMCNQDKAALRQIEAMR